MDEATLTVYIVDDDPAVRDSLSLLLSLRGYRTATFGSAEDFLAALRPGWCGCVMADIRMPGLSGLELQHELAHRGVGMPVVIITAHGDAASAREAFRANAVDFLEKPFDETGPLDAVEAAFERERERLDAGRESARREASLAALTERERDVMRLLVTGMHNKEVAQRLDISPRTVEIHKARVLAKLGARNVAELIRIAGSGGGAA
ncbi:MAG TPA: response regulator [Usitatibacter sp.]|nr:response regulator [Usitatibacter sp.]